jgi:hypothetical protein
MKLFVVERRETFVIAAQSYEEALEIRDEIDSYGTEVFESETMREATLQNISKQWASMEPSNLFDGTKLKDIAPELFSGSLP